MAKNRRSRRRQENAPSKKKKVWVDAQRRDDANKDTKALRQEMHRRKRTRLIQFQRKKSNKQRVEAQRRDDANGNTKQGASGTGKNTAKTLAV